MKTLLLMTFIFAHGAYGKPPQNADLYQCPFTEAEGLVQKPVFLSETKDSLVLGICGVKESDVNNFSHLKVQILSEKKKKKTTVFSDQSKTKKFLVLEKRDGLLLIEKVKIDQEYVELFRHDLVCDKSGCKMKKEICVVVNKVKKGWIAEHLKDSKIKARMKKTGC